MGSCSKGTFDTDPVWSEDFSLVALTSFTIAVTLLNPPVRNFKHSSVPFFAKLHILHIFPFYFLIRLFTVNFTIGT